MIINSVYNYIEYNSSIPVICVQVTGVIVVRVGQWQAHTPLKGGFQLSLGDLVQPTLFIKIRIVCSSMRYFVNFFFLTLQIWPFVK